MCKQSIFHHPERLLKFASIFVILGALAVGFLSSGIAHARDITVCSSGCDFASIQAASDSLDVPDGGVIRLLDAVHTEAGIQLDKDLIIQGQGAAETIVQAHPEPKVADERVFFITQGATVTLRDMTIRHGNPTSEPESGGGIHNQGTLTLENVIVRDNSGSAGGGILNDGTITLIDCTVSDNEARGGGVHYLECKTGGGLKNLTGEMTLINTTVRDNHALGKGGGIHAACKGTLRLINSTISHNNASGGGGGVFLNGIGEFIHSTIAQNEAKTGGGIYVEGTGEVGLVRGQLSYTNTLIAGNTARMEKYGVADCILGDHANIAVNKGNWVSDGQCGADYSGDPMVALLTERPSLSEGSDAPAQFGSLPQAHILLPDSPIVDILPPDACALETDQWGTARPQGAGCEIGAYELPRKEQAGSGGMTALLLSAYLLLVVVFVGWIQARSHV